MTLFDTLCLLMAIMMILFGTLGWARTRSGLWLLPAISGAFLLFATLMTLGQKGPFG